ncbi:MAG: M67 family metallopeptidase [Chitinophagales bacterium]|nr:M67 family metallopeptidase [Chitinophagales bacterium]
MLYLPSHIQEQLAVDAVRTYPDECCGFLLGTEQSHARTVTEIIAVHNAREGDKRRRYEIHPDDYRRAEKYADVKGLQLLGIYHSHPDHPSVPSEHDRAVAFPYFSYVILSVRQGEVVSVQSWRLNDNRHFDEEPVIHVTDFILT